MTQSHPVAIPPTFLVDDEVDILLASRITLRSHGITQVETLEDGRQLIGRIAQEGAAVVVVDLMMPQISGIDLLIEVKKHYPEIPVIVMTALEEVEVAIRCMKEGAFDYLLKPVEETRFVSAVKRAQEMYSLRHQLDTLRHHMLADGVEHQQAFEGIITQSNKMLALFRYAEAVAKSNEPVLITGETGTGKELVARAVHNLTERAGQFVAVNVAGMAGDLFSDTLFGHKKGAFSSADSVRSGLIHQAEGGTLFLDEIGDLNIVDQVKLLRLLQEGQYYPLGSDVPQRSNARIVVATNVNLQAKMRDETFRSDLFFRLSAHHLQIPSLRERKEDLPLLVSAFLQMAAKEMDKKTPTPPHELFTLLATYDYPGNVRELRALVWDAVARHQGGVLSMSSFRTAIKPAKLPVIESPQNVGDQDGFFSHVQGNLPTLKEAEVALVEEAMHRADNNQGIASGMLGISRSALNQRLKKMRSC
ncbi:sigma-54-dependent transcriptional regulator [Magnetococcus sp. PR-3]|uniref:sigma-54-dependent transcriptional regulator n=1 Tax=Magnetococcus sp. PR-3 TaxID=3120355 RepID=UPI002FCDF56E